MESAIKRLADTESLEIPSVVLEEALHMRRLSNLHEDLNVVQRARSKASLTRLLSAKSKGSLVSSQRSPSPAR